MVIKHKKVKKSFINLDNTNNESENWQKYQNFIDFLSVLWYSTDNISGREMDFLMNAGSCGKSCKFGQRFTNVL